MNKEHAENLAIKVLYKLLAGDNEKLLLLRKQFEYTELSVSKVDSAGFFVDFLKNKRMKEYELKEKNFEIGDVGVDQNLSYSNNIGFVLFIRDGYLSTLDVYFMDLSDDIDISKLKLVYDSDPRKI